NYPNPFNPATTINYYVPYASNVKIEIFNITGQSIKTLINGHSPAGHQTTTWNGTNNSEIKVETGIYIYTLKAAGTSTSKKMLLIK
ncbi:MAG: T9SS type A sorting domain-containing protein, partial [Calditrichia bacterium]|nr:T9SS type A sorting domain-containing protein [Calditrichia bacterium]